MADILKPYLIARQGLWGQPRKGRGSNGTLRRGGEDNSGVAKLLTDKEVQKIAGPGTKVVTYPELKKANSLEELFGEDKNVIILYLNERNGESFVGHWVLLTKRTEKGKNIVEFNDSYANEVDEFFDDIPQAYREQLEQERGFLSRLLYKWCKGNEELNEVHYNEVPFQRLAPDINTCGRWVGLRAHFSDIRLNKYQAEFKKLKREKYDLDKIVTIITDKLLLSKN
jgi:hypothetical protein